MADMTNELKEKLLTAKNEEEVAALLKDAGMDETEAKQLWAKLEHRREANGGELSLDELEAISGGKRYRNWKKDGCAATVEPGSRCWDDDQCDTWEVQYSQSPLYYKRCSRCGGYMCEDDYILGFGSIAPTYYCRSCGHRVNSISGKVYS